MEENKKQSAAAFILAENGEAGWLRAMAARAARVPGIDRVVVAFPEDMDGPAPDVPPADVLCVPGANVWERLLAAAVESEADILAAFQHIDALFHEASAARAVRLMARTGAGLVFPSGFVRGAAPLVFSRRALEWAVRENRERPVPLPPDKIILNDDTQDFICIAQQPPAFLNRPELGITKEFIEQIEPPPENVNIEETQKYYENVIITLDAEKKRSIASQCGEFTDTLFVSRKAQPEAPARVLLISNVTRVGGAETSLLLLAQNLDRNLFVPVIACPGPGELEARARAAGIETAVYELASVGQGPAAFLASSGSLAQIIRKQNIHIVHCNSIYACQMSVTAARAAGAPVVCHVRDLAAAPDIVNNAMLPACDKVLAVSGAVAETVATWGVDAKIIDVLYNGVNLEAFCPGLPRGAVRDELNTGDAPVIALIAHLTAWKGHRVFIHAAEKVLDEFPNAHFVMAGDELFPGRHGGYKEELQHDIAVRGLERSVHVLGPRGDVPAVLADTDVFVHASLLPDPCPRTVIEAMACGLPVIGAAAGGVPELLDGGNAGLLTAPGDAEALAQALLAILRDQEQSKHFGQTARTRAETEFDIKINTQKTEHIYRQILRAKAK